MSRLDELNEQIAAMRDECHRLEHACQLAWGTGDYYKIKAAGDAYDIAYARLATLVKRRLRKMYPHL
jgi:hypothetical protein